MLFDYPKQARFGRVLPKNKLYAHAHVSAALKRKFVDRVDKIVWEYKLSPETVNLPSVLNAPEIEIFSLHLRGADIGEDVLRVIDAAIPFPIIFELVFENRVKTKAAFKRPSDAEAGKWVTEIYFESDWRDVDAPRADLPTALDLGVLYEKILENLFAMPKKTGEDLRGYVQRLTLIRRMQSDAAKLEARIRKEKQFNRKMELSAELGKLKKELGLIDNS